MGNKSGKASAAAAARKHQQHAGHVVLPRATAACDALLPPFLVDFNVGKRVLLWLTPRDVLSFSLVNRACSALCLQDIVWAKLYRREKWGAKEPVAPGSVCCYKRAFMLRYTNCTERMARLRGTLHSVNKQLGDLTDLYRAKRDDLHRERLRTIGQIETKAKTCAWCVAFFCFFVEILCSLHGYDPLWAFFAALLVVVRHPIDALEELFPVDQLGCTPLTLLTQGECGCTCHLLCTSSPVLCADGVLLPGLVVRRPHCAVSAAGAPNSRLSPRTGGNRGLRVRPQHDWAESARRGPFPQNSGSLY
eukprot:TRINITY_DN4896_c0_g1_i3.p1 TRINITY_DN4896_c0_g1~~TRINITY_DN4896_c0_g1_i3.p1  ORF type:complete len:305 (+),score=35.35 TRINITY_DN4896_c0_g1_i3:32-946(+)